MNKKIYESENGKVSIYALTNNFGMKIGLEFEFNIEIIKLIKNTSWEKTHRQYNASNKTWEIDRTDKSIETIISELKSIENETANLLIEGLNTIQTPKGKSSKFVEFIVNSQNLKVEQYTYTQSAKEGTSFELIISSTIEDPNLKINPIFVIFFNRKISNRLKEKWGRGMTNVFPHIAELFNIPVSEFNDMLRSNLPNVLKADKIQQIFSENPRQLKILTTTPNKFLNEFDKDRQFNVYNIASEIFETVTFNNIGNIVKEEISKQTGIEYSISFPESLSDAEQLYPYSIKNEENTIEQTKMGGSIVWKWKVYNNSINKEKLTGMIIISSGNNVKKSAMKVIGVIKVGSCDNTIKAFIRDKIRHTTNWETKLRNSINNAIITLKNAVDIIKNAMNKTIYYIEAVDKIKKMKFRLKKEIKIEKLRSLILERLRYEYDKNPTLWAVSQSLSYIGTHARKQEIDLSEFNDNTFDYLNKLAFDSIN